MASYYKRPRSPFLWISYKDVDGKQKIVNSKLRHDQTDEADTMCREFERQVDIAPKSASAMTISQWAEKWFKERETKIKSMKDDKSRIKKHILPRIGSIELRRLRKADVQAVFDSLRINHEQTGKPASGTIKSIFAATKVMFNDAVAADLIPASPLFLTSKSLPSVHKKARLPYTLAEVEQILLATPEQVPDDRRMLYAILFFFGLRFGEGAALRWCDLDTAMEPLAKMDVAKAWSNARKKMDTTKTGAGTERKAPVHPVVYFLLQQWRDVGFPALFGREPKADDLIVPSREGRPRSSNHGMKRLRQDLERLEFKHLEMRTQHAFRTSFISQMRVAAVDKDKVRAVTHGKRSSGDVIDAFYTVWPWEVLCGAVMQMPFSEGFLHFFYTAVSAWKDSEKWRGGRDSNSVETRYTTLLRAQLQSFSASRSSAGSVGVEAFSTLPGAYPTPVSTLEDPTMPEPLTWQEIFGQGDKLSANTAALLERVRTYVPEEIDTLSVCCGGCLRTVEVDARRADDCPACGAELLLEGAVYVVG